MFAHNMNASSTLQFDTYLIINGSKWPIVGGLNHTASAGVKAEMIVEATLPFL
jgi:hypothetical protein